MDPDPLCFKALFIAIDVSVAFGFALLFLLLICSALVSGAEVSLFSLTRTDIEEGLEQKSRRIEIISKLLERPKKLLATILVANNFINIAIVILFAYLGEIIFKDINTIFDLYVFEVSLKFILEVILVTFLILLFGEILPKIYASRNNLKFASFMAYPLRVLDVLLSPMSVPMQNATIAIHNRLGRRKSN